MQILTAIMLATAGIKSPIPMRESIQYQARRFQLVKTDELKKLLRNTSVFPSDENTVEVYFVANHEKFFGDGSYEMSRHRSNSYGMFTVKNNMIRMASSDGAVSYRGLYRSKFGKYIFLNSSDGTINYVILNPIQ